MGEASRYGFVLRYSGGSGPLSVSSREVATELGKKGGCLGLEVVSRPYHDTPEALSETQPLYSDKTILAYEGRIDNRSEVATQLGRPDLVDASDGVVILAAHEGWGADASRVLIGEFAYVAFDCTTGRVIAGQDSMGVRRIFYKKHSGKLLVTSNLRMLFSAFPAERPSFDDEILPEYFAGTMSPWSGGTIWKGIQELGRAKALVVDDGVLSEVRTWVPPPVVRRDHRTMDDAADEFRSHLLAGVYRAMRSPGGVLCDLSGGYDSSTICALASMYAKSGEVSDLRTWSFGGARSEELDYQEAMRRRLGLECHLVDLDHHLPFTHFRDIELPTGGFIQMGAIEREVSGWANRHGIRARLTGHGADVLLGKGPQAPVYLAEWLRAGRLGEWAQHLVAYLRGGAFSAKHLLWDCSVGTIDMHAGTFRRPLPVWLRPAFRRRVDEASRRFLYATERTCESDARERVLRSTMCFIPYHGRMLPDERLPLIHRPLVEFILSLDWRYLVRANEDRVLMRRALRNELPELVLAGGSASHISASLHEGLQQAWANIASFVTGECLADLGVVELQPFREALGKMRAGYSGPNRQASKTALYLETWLGWKRAQSQGFVDRSGRN